MEFELGRLSWWLGQNAAAIQALSAMVTTLLTLVLVAVMWRYVLLARSMLTVSEKHVLAEYQPNISIMLEATLWTGEVAFSLQNEGRRTVRLIGVEVGWTYPGDPLMRGRLSVGLDNRNTLRAGESIPFNTRIRREVDEVPATFFNDLAIYVDCKDLTAPGEHCFTFSRNRGLDYFNRFKTSPNEFRDGHISYGDSLS